MACLSRITLLFLVPLVFTGLLQGQADDLPIARITLLDSLTFADQRQLLGLMKLQAPSILGFASTPFSRRALKVDAITIRNFFVSRGYLEAQVVDSFAVLPDDRVEVYLKINRGKQYRLSQVSITGNRLMSREELLEFLGIQLEEPYNPVEIRNRLEALRHHYQDRGKLTIDMLEEIEVEDGIHLRLTISEGLTFMVGQVTIQGLTQVPEWTVRRELLFQRGDTFDRSKLLLSQQRIFESGMFSSVEIIPTIRADEPGVANLEVRIRELQRRSFDLSLGFRQTEPPVKGEPNTALYGSVQWWVARIFNSSVRTGITVEGDLILENLGTPNFLLAWDIITPWTFGLRMPTSIRFFSDYRASAGDTVWQNGIELSLLSKRLERSRTRAAFGWVIVTATGGAAEEKTIEGAEPRLSVDYLYQGVDNLLEPHRGTIFRLQPSLRGTFIEGVSGFAQLGVDFRRYRPLKFGAVLAYRLKLSGLQTWPAGSGHKLKPYHLFELGGSTSLRGWAQPDSFSQEGGGLATILSNIELRTPLFWIIGGQLFADAGALYTFLTPKDRGYDPEQPALKWLTGWDLGAGLLLSTPLGPIRMDVAFRGTDLYERKWNPTFQVAFLHTF